MSRVPPHASGGNDQPRAEELEQLEELGDDAIIAQQQGAHIPKPRAQVTEEARSIVISDHPAPGSNPPDAPQIPAAPAAKKRSERNEKTVLIRDRRQIDELRREIEKRKPKVSGGAPSQGLLLWVIVGLAAFLAGGLVALFATRDDGAAAASTASTASIKPIVSAEPPVPSPAPIVTAEPPSVSIDQLPLEGTKK